METKQASNMDFTWKLGYSMEPLCTENAPFLSNPFQSLNLGASFGFEVKPEAPEAAAIDCPAEGQSSWWVFLYQGPFRPPYASAAGQTRTSQPSGNYDTKTLATACSRDHMPISVGKPRVIREGFLEQVRICAGS